VRRISFNGIDYVDTRPLPEEFIDSTAAVSIAGQLHGAEYRKRGKPFRLPLRLTTWRSVMPGPPDPIPHRATWQIEYLATQEIANVTREAA
jgi:hypothetical protein